jgi:hypothetical protein
MWCYFHFAKHKICYTNIIFIYDQESCWMKEVVHLNWLLFLNIYAIGHSQEA